MLKNVDGIKGEIGWAILTDDKCYEEVVGKLDDKKKARLDRHLTDIFRYLETTTIKIEHEVIDEKICFDYLFSVLITLVDKCGGFIEISRQERKKPRLYEHAVCYAKKWKAEIQEGRVH